MIADKDEQVMHGMNEQEKKEFDSIQDDRVFQGPGGEKRFLRCMGSKIGIQ